MITKIEATNKKVTQTCASCAAVRVLDTTGIRLGHRRNPDQINLPVCPCGAREVLIRPKKNERTGIQSGPHRKLVHAFGKFLISEGQVQTIAPDRGGQNFDDAVAAGHLTGKGADHDFAVDHPVTDCIDFNNAVALAEVESEMVKIEIKFQGNHVKRMKRAEERVTKSADQAAKNVVRAAEASGRAATKQAARAAEIADRKAARLKAFGVES